MSVRPLGKFTVANAAKIDIKSLLFNELQVELREQGEPSYRAGQITDWLYTKRVESFERMTDLPDQLRTRLAKHFAFDRLEVVRVLGSRDTTRKFLFRLADGDLIESVLIPASPALYGAKSDRRTICISTQVGCAYGCKFCASGLEGSSRNLSARRDGQSAQSNHADQSPLQHRDLAFSLRLLCCAQKAAAHVRIHLDRGRERLRRASTSSFSPCVPPLCKSKSHPLQFSRRFAVVTAVAQSTGKVLVNLTRARSCRDAAP